MSFSKVVCWDKSMVSQVMETDAFQVSDDIFLATHYPIKAYIDESKEGRGIPIPVSEKEIMDRFFEPKNYCFGVVLGSAGTGKSHLIRWMNANIPTNDKRRVIRVPKSGISLRKVIELIIDQVSDKRFDGYRDRLKKAIDNLTPHQAREILLNDLAVAVGTNGMSAQGTLNEFEEYLVHSLPSLLYDQHFRSFFLRDGGVIHNLVVHILGDSEQIERIEERRGFKVNDLPLNFSDIKNAGAAARDFYTQLLSDDEIKNETVKWLNNCLNDAISRLLNFSGNDLMELMFDVRKELGKQNIELIILIEDLAKTQGIDSQLLDALLERRTAADGTKLCVMRIAIAATTGFFEKSVDTTKHRFDFRIYLDHTEQNSLMTKDDMVSMASLYLNTIRLSNEKIRTWYNNSTLNNNPSPIENACLECKHRDQCRNAFGDVHGVGIYPFTSTAIIMMFNRIKAKDKGFNPRLLITDVLGHTLYNYGDRIKTGQFPPTALLQHFGGLEMSALMINEIEQRDPLNSDRRKVLMQLWTDNSKLINLNHDIHQAFSLPELGAIAEESISEKPKEKPEVPNIISQGPVENEIPSTIKEYIRKLDNWPNENEKMSQNLVNELRPLLYSAITHHIDWDANLMLKSDFIGLNKPFQQRGISFLRQGTQEVKTIIVPLRIPLNNNIETDDVLALQGLILYNHFKTWTFPEGAVYYLAYAERLEMWSQYVLNQLKKSASLTQQWDPVPAIVESLVVTSLMCGARIDSNDKVSLINNFFANLNTVDNSNRTKEWQELYTVLEKNNLELKKHLFPWISCTKGQISAVQMIDAVQLIKPIWNLRNNNWIPVSEIPEDYRSEYKIIYHTNKKIRETLPKVIEEEHNALKNWADTIIVDLGNDYGDNAINQVKELIQQVKNSGISPWKSLEPLEKVLNDFRRSKRQGVIEHAKRMESLDDKRRILPLLGQVDVKAIAAIDTFITEVNNFLEAVESRLETDEANLSMDEQQLSKVQLEIADNLICIKEAFESDLSKLPQLSIQNAEEGE